MQASFDYVHQTVAMDSIEIGDVGNCALNVLNDNAEEWYLAVATEMGWTTVIQFGPLIADIDDLPNSFYFSRNKFEYSEKGLVKTIYNFLNDNKRGITQAFEIDYEEAMSRLRGVINDSSI